MKAPCQLHFSTPVPPPRPWSPVGVSSPHPPSLLSRQLDKVRLYFGRSLTLPCPHPCISHDWQVFLKASSTLSLNTALPPGFSHGCWSAHQVSVLETVPLLSLVGIFRLLSWLHFLYICADNSHISVSERRNQLWFLACIPVPQSNHFLSSFSFLDNSQALSVCPMGNPGLPPVPGFCCPRPGVQSGLTLPSIFVQATLASERPP